MHVAWLRSVSALSVPTCVGSGRARGLLAGVQVDVAPRVVGVDRVTGLVLLGLERERHVRGQAPGDLVDLLVRPGAGDATEAGTVLEVLDLLDLGLERLLGDALGHRHARGLLVVGVVHLRDEAGVGVGRVDGEAELDDAGDGQGGDEGQELDGRAGGGHVRSPTVGSVKLLAGAQGVLFAGEMKV